MSEKVNLVAEKLEEMFGTVVHYKDNVVKTTVRDIPGDYFSKLADLEKSCSSMMLKRSGTSITVIANV